MLGDVAMHSRGDGDGECQMLTEEQLKHMSRISKTLVPQFNTTDQIEDDLKNFHSLLDRVFQAAETPILNATHRVAAWNTLCALIDQFTSSNSDALSRGIDVQSFWNRAFALYLNQSQTARPKSSKQLLTTLSTVLKRTAGSANKVDHVSRPLISGVFSEDDHRRAKACLQALAHFLTKDVLDLVDVASCLNDKSPIPSDADISTDIKHLLTVLLTWVGKGDFGSVVSQVVTVVLVKYQALANDASQATGSSSKQVPIWADALDSVVVSGNVQIEELRIHIFPILFKRSLADYVAFLEAHGLQQLAVDSTGFKNQHEVHDTIFYAALQTGKELGLVYETDNSAIIQTSSSVGLPVRYIGQLLRRSSRTVRLTGLSLLITSHAATRPFPRATFKLMKRYLNSFFGDTDANFRGEVFSLMQKLMDRLRAITAVLARQSVSKEGATQTLGYHQSFLGWFVGFLHWELRPTASYQRHISALKTLMVVARSGVDQFVPDEYFSKAALAETKWPFHLSIMSAGMEMSLLDLLVDPFDDVRQTAASILSYYAADGVDDGRQDAHENLLVVIERAESRMLATGRADQADGVAHMYALLFATCKGIPSGNPTTSLNTSGSDFQTPQRLLTHLVQRLEQMLKVARSSLASATSKYPMHGLLTSIRYVINQGSLYHASEALLQRLATCLQEVWSIVKHVLCNDAPEGYQIEEAGDTPEVSTKDTLSYCWRALKESNLLLGTIVTSKTSEADMILALSKLCFTQLAELRHRGAFSTVAQTWIACCIRCQNLQDEKGQNMLHSWYDQVLRILNERVTINTRRSAGIPSLICGLLISDLTRELVKRTFEDLAVIAAQPIDSSTTQESSLPQVHALNCIKDVLKNTRLSEPSERYLPQSLELAARSLRSEAWAIRNCGLMLFRAVIDRLLGTSESHLEDDSLSTRRISTHQHPQLLDVVLDLLVTSPNSLSTRGTEGVFPALQLLLLSKIPEERLENVQRAVFRLTASPSWHIRDKAARTYASILDIQTADLSFGELLSTNTTDQNALHGTLLCVRYVLARINAAQESFMRSVDGISTASRTESGGISPRKLYSVMRSASHIYNDNQCSTTRAAYVDIMADYTKSLQDSTIQVSERQTGDDTSGDVGLVNELQMLVEDIRPPHDSAVLIQSLSRALPHEFCHRGNVLNYESREMAQLIVSLGQKDADACSSMFLELRHNMLSSMSMQPQMLEVVLTASSSILRNRGDMTLKCEIQFFLLCLADQEKLSRTRDAHSHDVFINACASSFTPLDTNANQNYADQSLQLQAVVLESRLENDNIEESTVNAWISSCSQAIQEHEFALFTREAAAVAISQVRYLWRFLVSRNSSHFLDLCLAVYDLLNDDDEEVRLLAAQSTALITSTNPQSDHDIVLEPLEASQSLLRFMLKRWAGNSSFANAAFSRAFSISASSLVSVAEQLKLATTVDTALFAEEKQNLYIDEAREAKVWAQVLLQINPRAISSALIRHLASWVSDGLDELLDRTTADHGGALGWNTKAEAFVLGLQVLYGAEVLLHMAGRGVKLPVRPSEIRLKLGRLVMAASAGGVSELWIREVTRITTSALTSYVLGCGKLLGMVARVVEREPSVL